MYPVGQFRTLEDGQSFMYFSNGTDAFCRYVTPAHAGVISAHAIATIYDQVPRRMRNDGFCPNAGTFMPR